MDCSSKLARLAKVNGKLKTQRYFYHSWHQELFAKNTKHLYPKDGYAHRHLKVIWERLKLLEEEREKLYLEIEG